MPTYALLPPTPTPTATGLAEVCGVAVSYFPDRTGSVCLSSVGDERVNPSPSPTRSAPHEGPIHMVLILGPNRKSRKWEEKHQCDQGGSETLIVPQRCGLTPPFVWVPSSVAAWPRPCGPRAAEVLGV